MHRLFFAEKFSFAQKTKLTLSLCAVILFLGIFYQFLYHRHKAHCQAKVTEYYRIYMNQAPPEIHLRHLTNLAANRWGLKRVEKVFFIGENGTKKT